ncbi:MAG: HAD family hydrolase [Candidatus Omnitrophica bacterium]|nr:HAD family hydrolase [Candidatus Omnitrophota bacterium]MCB9767108.1 HAD family hydrolase [Candidatus Omnitrophota bacterium]MCB9781515.1 HAD family hydrolase [Candidatus Omnitrophota bacterium]
MTQTQLTPNIEIINANLRRGHFKHAVFDFDGTISLIREGWQDVMIPMMVEILMATGTDESEQEIHDLVKLFVTDLTGKQTIYQMIRLAEEVEKRGGTPKEPVDYKWQYLDLLNERIKDRLDALKSGSSEPIDWVVPGSYDLLNALKDRGTRLYLASGTDEKFVFEEAELLKTTEYFDGIYGAQDDYKKFSKKMVIERILRENEVSGEELITFGDGYVEIENTHDVGGVGIGVATDEKNRVGVDDWKRSRLIKAGADVIIPEYRETAVLVPYLYGETE